MLSVPDMPQTNNETINVFDQITKMGHEQVVYCNDPATGLKAIIAIHDTTLGPALGGTRFWNYASEADALKDVLRLSRGMTYKAAISGVNLGGGKAVIIGDSKQLSNEAFWRRYGQFIDNLNGRYISAEDVGTSTEYIGWAAQETKHVVGKPESMGGAGDPSPVTAYGVFLGIKASAKQVWGTDSVAGKKVLVEGIGHVGESLVNYLTKDGALVYVSDISDERVNDAVSKYGATAVPVSTALDTDIDIYAPCALGATLNTHNIERLKAHIVAGAANNQLEDEDIHGNMLKDRGILYAPDFLINSGGLINCFSELNGYVREEAMNNTEKIYDLTLNIFKKAQQENVTTHQAAMILAKERLFKAGKANPK